MGILLSLAVITTCSFSLIPSETKYENSRSSVLVSDEIDSNSQEDVAVNVFFKERAPLSLGREEKIAFYTSYTQKQTDKIAETGFDPTRITCAKTMPVLTMHYDNAKLDDVKADIGRRLHWETISRFISNVTMNICL